MRITKRITIVGMLLVLGIFSLPIEAKQPGVLLQEGMYAEEIDGDLDKAIEIYQQVAQEKSATDAQAAHALYRLGMCYLKKQDESKAKAAFEKILAQYPNQTNTVEKAKPLLEELVNHDPSALMPADTKIYVELGSPGKQIETILNMLKGTPLENPLQMMGAGQTDQNAGSDEQSIQNIIAALMNPSMIAEFKKIRGMAFGISKVPMEGGEPDFIGVLNPGKSDALRGIILAALGMFGQAGQPIEGMQTVIIQPEPSLQIGVAYDNNIILVAHPMEQLNWCVKQYKGVTDNPTLISQNQGFAKIPRQNRSDNVITIWVDGAGMYSEIPELLKQDMEFQLIDRIGDLKSIEELLLQVSLQEQSVIFDTSVSLKEGHNCLPYNMMRTPNLSKTGFQGVPSNTVGLISFALGEPQRQLGVRAQQVVEGLTGLDIGREIFANIEQVTVFAVPSTPAAEAGAIAPMTSPIVYCLGAAITSHNPQKTRQLLSQALVIGEMISNMQNRSQRQLPTALERDKYYIGDGWDKELNKAVPAYLYIGQAGKTTVLSLNPEIVEASVTAVQTKQSVLNGGPLHETLRQLSGDTSKLALVNVGGAIQLGESHLRVAEFKNAQEAPPLLDLLKQLAQACEETSVQFRTGETVNNFTLQASVNDLPSFGVIFPLLMQMDRVASSGPRDEAMMSVAPEDHSVEGTAQKLQSWLNDKEPIPIPSLAPAKVKLVSAPSKDEFGNYMPTNPEHIARLRESEAPYRIVNEGLQVGTMIYSDRAYKISDLSADLQGLTLLQTMNGNKEVGDNSFSIQVSFSKPGYVFLALDSRLIEMWSGREASSWIRGYFPTGYRVGTDEPNQFYKYLVVAKKVDAGTTVLGPPMGTGSSSMYFAFFAEAAEPMATAEVSR